MPGPFERAGSDLSRRDVLRWGLAGTIAVSAGGLLTACGGGSTSPNADVPTGPAQRGGTLTVGLISGGKAESVDPWVFLDTSGYLRVIQLYDTLVEFNDDLSVRPALAESTEVSADKQTWTFRLREGVTFHDGSALTADDLIFNIENWVDPNSWPASNGGTAIDPKKVKKLDDLTVRVGLTAPDARFDRTLAFLAFSIKSRNEKKGGSAIGTGPFKLVSFTPGSRSEFERFEDHWRDEPVYLDRLIVDTSFTDENARTNALRGGQVDLLPLVSFAQAKTLPADAATLLRAKSGCFNNLYMSLDSAPFDDVNVRQAMRLMVDRQELVDVTYAGFGSVSNDIPGRFTPNYQESFVRERDVDQAKSLLKKAGKENLTVTLQAVPGYDSLTQAATLFKAHAKDAGVTVNIEQIDQAAYWGQYGSWSFAQTLYFPVYSMETIWSSSFLSVGGVNETHWYASPDFERSKSLVMESKATEDESKLQDIWTELQQQQFDTGGYINYGTYDFIDAVGTNVKGLTPSQYLYASGCNLRKAWLDS